MNFTYSIPCDFWPCLSTLTHIHASLYPWHIGVHIRWSKNSGTLYTWNSSRAWIWLSQWQKPHNKSGWDSMHNYKNPETHKSHHNHTRRLAKKCDVEDQTATNSSQVQWTGRWLNKTIKAWTIQKEWKEVVGQKMPPPVSKNLHNHQMCRSKWHSSIWLSCSKTENTHSNQIPTWQNVTNNRPGRTNRKEPDRLCYYWDAVTIIRQEASRLWAQQ